MIRRWLVHLNKFPGDNAYGIRSPDPGQVVRDTGIVVQDTGDSIRFTFVTKGQGEDIAKELRRTADEIETTLRAKE